MWNILKNGKGIDWEAELRNVYLDPPLTAEEIEQIERLKESFRKQRARGDDPEQLMLFDL